MKLIYILTLFSLSAFANDTIIIGASNNETSIGFTDSSFSYNPNKSFCFIGSMSEVCDQVYYDAYKMQSSYASGAHDTIEIKACGIKEVGDNWESDRNEIFVEVKYKLTDDYGGDIDVTKKIDVCR